MSNLLVYSLLNFFFHYFIILNFICLTYFQRIEQKKTIYVTSCISALKMWFKDHMFLVGALAVALAFPQFLGIILTHIFVGQIQEQIEECSKPPMYKYRPDRQPLNVYS